MGTMYWISSARGCSRDEELDRQDHGHDHARRQREGGHAHRAIAGHELLLCRRPRGGDHLDQNAGTPMANHITQKAP